MCLNIECLITVLDFVFALSLKVLVFVVKNYEIFGLLNILEYNIITIYLLDCSIFSRQLPV